MFRDELFINQNIFTYVYKKLYLFFCNLRNLDIIILLLDTLLLFLKNYNIIICFKKCILNHNNIPTYLLKNILFEFDC